MRLREFTNLGPPGAKPGAPPTKNKLEAIKDDPYIGKSKPVSFDPHVLELQQELKKRDPNVDLGPYGPRGDGLDGILGPKTIAASRKFPDLAKKYSDTLLQDGYYEVGTPQVALKFFMNQGWTAAQAAGIVGNLQAESNLITNAKGDGGEAYGIAQWHSPRRARFEDIKKKPMIKSNFMDQLEFVHWELTNDEANAGRMLKQAKTPEEAAEYFEKYYERTAVSSKGGYSSDRAAKAVALYPAANTVASTKKPPGSRKLA